MTAPETRPTRTRHPTLWTVEAVRWEFRKEGAEGPVVQLGEGLDAVEVPDRALAIAIGHHLFDKHAEKAVGPMSLEIHLHPPEQDAESSDEVREQPAVDSADSRPRHRKGKYWFGAGGRWVSRPNLVCHTFLDV